MQQLSRIVETFPSVRIIDDPDRLPIEVSLIAQLGHGAGNHLFSSIAARQKKHADFVDELDEPSAKLAGTNFSLGDTTSLYSFIVGPKGHPFHCHAGHRIFTAVSGSGGAQLRFATATTDEIKQDAKKFINSLHFINIPPDCLFTVRFGGDTWHQFAPLSKNSLHPVFFALSCHTDELGGNLPDELKQQIINNKASIPSLTELLPDKVSALIHSKRFRKEIVQTTTLSLDAAAGTKQRKVCDTFRGSIGMLRGAWGGWYASYGFVSQTDTARSVVEMDSMPEGSLLLEHLNGEKLHHNDTFMVTINGTDFKNITASNLLEVLLEGFLINAPRGVSRLMLVRNILVKPLGLRTSPLGCPVSSLLSNNQSNLFANQYPVLDQRINQENTHAQVILGADDKHLKFRSCVGIEVMNNKKIIVTLGTRVNCINWFGRFYMATIDYVHRHYVTPTMLRRAVDFMVSRIS